MHRARQLRAALVTTLLSTAGLAQQHEEGLSLFIEAGVRTPDAADALSRVLKTLPDMPRELGRALRHFDEIESRSFPLTFRLYTPGGWSHEESPEPPYFVVVVDSADELPIEHWLESYGVAKRGSGSFLYEERQRVDGGRRYLLGNRLEEVRQELRHLKGDRLPQPSRAQHRLIGEVSNGEAYAFADLARAASRKSLKELHAAGGDEGTMFALGAQQSRGAWMVDIHWSVRSGEGMVGGFLADHGQFCRLDGLLPWKPAVALQANPGKGFGRQLAYMNVTQMVPGDARKLLGELLDVWEGPVGFFQPEPDRSYRPPSFVPPTLKLGPEYVVLLRVDRTRGDRLVEELVEALGGMVERTEAGTFAFDETHRSTHFGHRRGVVAVCSTEEPETAARYLEHVLDAAEGRGRAKWRMDRELDGIVQLWLSPAASRRLAKTAPGPGRSDPGREWIHHLLTVPSDFGLGASLLPSRDSLRLRLKF